MSITDNIKKQLEQSKQKLDQEQRRLLFHTPDSIAEPWAEMIDLSFKHPLSIGFPSHDEVLEHSLRCKVGAHIGYGGTKKSLAVAQQSFINSETHGATCFLSSMEMAKELLFERQVNYAFEPRESLHGFEKQSASKYWKEQVRLRGWREVAAELSEGVKRFFGDKIRISDTSRMTVEEYDKVIEKYKEEGLKIDMLAVDGLSRMGGSKDGETAQYSYNVGELKDLANTHKIYIPLICHCSKGATKHTRNIASYVRGSEKIIDDCDFQMMFSLCQDQMNPELYLNDVGYVRLFDKRGTGMTKDIIYDFDVYTLRMTERLQDDPSKYELTDNAKW